MVYYLINRMLNYPQGIHSETIIHILEKNLFFVKCMQQKFSLWKLCHRWLLSCDIWDHNFPSSVKCACFGHHCLKICQSIYFSMCSSWAKLSPDKHFPPHKLFVSLHKCKCYDMGTCYSKWYSILACMELF
jgi:hypothetical protein